MLYIFALKLKAYGTQARAMIRVCRVFRVASDAAKDYFAGLPKYCHLLEVVPMYSHSYPSVIKLCGIIAEAYDAGRSIDPRRVYLYRLYCTIMKT